MAAAITADIVNFSLLPLGTGKKLVTQISNIIQEYTFEFYRGDSLQIYCKDASAALDLVCKIRTTARNMNGIYDVRASIGIGKVNTPIKNIKTAGGEAFVLSGRAFDQLNAQNLQIISGDEKANISLQLISGFCDYLLKKMTSKQAEVVLKLLEGKTQTVAAESLMKSQSTINKHAKSANWNEIEKLLALYKKTIIQFKLT